MVNGFLMPKFLYYTPWFIATGVLVTIGGGT